MKIFDLHCWIRISKALSYYGGVVASSSMNKPISRTLKNFLKFAVMHPHMLIIEGSRGLTLVHIWSVPHEKDAPNIFMPDNTTNMLLSQQICFSMQVEIL
jgi:hypothetical protein